MKTIRALAWLLLSGLTVALTIWTYYWLHAFFHDLKEVMVFGLPTTSIGLVLEILLLDYLRGAGRNAVRHHDTVAKASIRPVLGGLLSIISGLLGGVIVNPIVLLFVLGFHGNFATMALLLVPSIVCGLLAVVGGVLAVRRRRYRMALLGSIMAIPSLVFMGVPAFVLVAASRNEFGDTVPTNPQMVAAGNS
jgi:hypothetical protein